MTKCQVCKKAKQTRTALVNGKYYKAVCNSCLGNNEDEINSSVAGYERRRVYEDDADSTVQPYDANGKPRSEFFRLYPDAAKKTFTREELDQVKRKI
jgi:hypothetical protein